MPIKTDTVQSIAHTCARDVGCEIAEEEFFSYLEMLQEQVQRCYPTAVVTFDVGIQSQWYVHTKSGMRDDDVEQELKELANEVWDAGEFWNEEERLT